MSSQPSGTKPEVSSGKGTGRAGAGGSRSRRSGGGRGQGQGGGGRGGANKEKDDNVDKSNKQQQPKQEQKSKTVPQKNQPAASDSTQKPQASSSKSNRSRNQKNSQQAQKNKGSTKSDHQPRTTEVSSEEKQRIEQERRDKEAAALLKQQQEDAQRRATGRAKEKQAREDALIEARDVLRSTMNIAIQHRSNRTELSPDILGEFRRDFENNKKKLKTDLKKCTTFVKKVKSGAAWSMKASDIQQDISVLNLSRYVEEVVQAVTEPNIKITDVPTVTVLCMAMHQRYAEFLPNLLPALWSVVNSASVDTAKLRRLYVRLLTEFLLNGLIPSKDIKTFVKCITDWTGANSGYAVQDANLVVAFGRAAGFEIFGITPSSVASAMSLVDIEMRKAQSQALLVSQNEDSISQNLDGAEGPVMLNELLVNETIELRNSLQSLLNEQRAIAVESTELILKHFHGAYGTLSTSLIQTHRKLQKLEKRCEQDRLLSGSITEAREKGLNDARKLLDSLLKSVESLSDCLNQPVPLLEDEEDDNNSQSGVGVEVWTKGGDGEGTGEDFGPFDDEETRSFYCDVPDLIATYPPALLGLQPDEIEKKKIDNARKYGSDQIQDTEDDERIEEVAPSSEEQLDAEEEEAQREMQKDNEELDEAKLSGTENENRDTPHYRLMMLLEQELPECHRREQIDEITEKFCSTHGASRNSRKRLLKTLFLVSHSRLDLLPYYSRMAAIVDRIWVDIASPLVTDLEQQFHGQAKFKKNQNLDSRMKTARYIGELTKFRVAPPIVALRCIQRCIEDFTGSNVDVACCILESCGRFLFRTKHASSRLVTLMDTMTRLSKAKNLDDRLQSLLKAAYYTVKPPPNGPRRKAKEYPPVEAYLRHLLLVRLEATDSSISLVAKQLARLPWSDPSQQCGLLVCKLFLKACRKGRYKTIQAIAAVAAKLRSQRAACEATIRLVDAVIEEIRWALEYPNFRDQQRIVTYARLLGELHCAGLVSAQIVLDQLYDFINLGHEIPESLREVSKKLAADISNPDDANIAGEKLKVYNSAGGATNVIKEDEEMEETELVTKEDVAAVLQPVAVPIYSKFDPRVPSSIDPQNSFYRITLICSLLEVVAKPIVSRSNAPRLKSFMAAFQRYLFTKDALPTDVEFALLDTFDILDSQLKRLPKGSTQAGGGQGEETGFLRYSCWVDAHNATVGNEESEALFESQKRARLESLLDDSKEVGEMNETIEGNSLQDDDSMLEDDEDDVTLSLSAKDSIEGNDDMDQDIETDVEDEDNHQSIVTDDEKVDVESESDGDTEDDEDVEDDDEFDEEAYLRHMQEESFERELRRITMDALEKGKNASRKQIGESMVSGSQIFKKKDQPKSSEGLVPSSGIALGGKVGVSFQLLKKGNKGKVEARELLVPADTNLAMVATKQDDAAARERDEIKQRVLRYEAESAEAEYSGGNVYLEQEKLQVIRNRPLSLDEIDRNFGTTGGSLRQSQNAPNKFPQPSSDGRGRTGRAGHGRGGGRGRGGRSNIGGRTLFG